MKLKNTLLASALLSATAFSINTATELTPEQAAAVKPFDHVVVTSHFNAIGKAVKAISHHADKEGATSFYVVNTSDFGNSSNWHVVTDLYKANAEKAEETSNHVINSVVKLPKDQAVLIEPFDTVTIQGFYHSQPEVNDAITKAAKAKGAYSFYIIHQINANQGSNQHITAFIYKKDAKKHIIQSPDVIPADSKAGHAALAASGKATKKVEIPGVATTTSPSSEVSRFFETQSSKGRHYTITLPDGTKVKELNKATTAMMVPFNSIKFSGNYSNMTKVSYQVAKHATKKGAKYYHITHQWQEHGNNLTISADLYK